MTFRHSGGHYIEKAWSRPACPLAHSQELKNRYRVYIQPLELQTWPVLSDQAEVDHQELLNLNITPAGWDRDKGIRRIIAAEKAA